MSNKDGPGFRVTCTTSTYSISDNSARLSRREPAVSSSSNTTTGVWNVDWKYLESILGTGKGLGQAGAFPRLGLEKRCVSSHLSSPTSHLNLQSCPTALDNGGTASILECVDKAPVVSAVSCVPARIQRSQRALRCVLKLTHDNADTLELQKKPLGSAVGSMCHQ